MDIQGFLRELLRKRQNRSFKPVSYTHLEAEGTYAHTTLHAGFPVKKAELTNMLEEVQETLPSEEGIPLTFRPFEIKTIKFSY